MFNRTPAPKVTVTRATPDHAEDLSPSGYDLRPIVQVALGEFKADLWLHRTRQDNGGVLHELDVTIDGIGPAASDGLGDSPERLRRLASVVRAAADELEESQARLRHPAGRGLRGIK
jgi:hypothetical protein